MDFVRGCCSKSSDEEEDDEEAPQEPVKAKRGRSVERKDADGEKDRARKTANLARRPEIGSLSEDQQVSEHPQKIVDTGVVHEKTTGATN